MSEPRNDARTGAADEDAEGLPVYAEDGTDLTVIRWMLALSAEERLRWLQSHMQAVAALTRDQADA